MAAPLSVLRGAAKAAAERLLVLGADLGVLRGAQGRGALVLAYHDVVPSGERPAGDRSLHLPLASFKAQLEVLASVAEVVPLATLLDATLLPSGRPRVAITFDDAYRGALDVALPLLVRLGWPATVFVAPALLGAGATWWDAVASEEGGLRASVRDHALWQCQGRVDAVRAWAVGGGLAWRAMPTWAEPATEDELRAAAQLPGISLGLHSWEHANLAALTQAEVHADLERSLRWFADRELAVQPVLAYPYGLEHEAARAAARAAGCTAAFRVDGGWMRPNDSPFALRRLNVPAGLSRDGFRLRLAGLLC